MHTAYMSVFRLCPERRAEVRLLKSLHFMSNISNKIPCLHQLQQRTHSRNLSLDEKTRLQKMRRGLRTTLSDNDVQTMAEKLQTMQIIEKTSASSNSQIPASAKKQSVPAKSKRMSAGEARESKIQPSTASGGIPNPTMAYLTASDGIPQLLSQPQHLLVVIDLNGTLLFRPNRKQPTKFVARPNTIPFLKYCVDTFSVVIWSSAKPENVKHMCNAILTPELREKVIAIWGRDKFGLSKQDFDLRVQCYKRLTKLWSDRAIARTHPEYARGACWDQTNTVLVDDSPEKGRSEPFNIIEVPEFSGNANEQGRILPQVHDYLNHLSMHSNVSACLRSRPFKPQITS